MTTSNGLGRRCVLTLAFLLASCAAPAQRAPTKSVGRFDEALDRIGADAWQPLSRTELEHRALRALVADMDPYGQVLDAAQWADFKGGLSATVAGVGVVLHDDALPLRIERLLIGAPRTPLGCRGRSQRSGTRQGKRGRRPRRWPGDRPGRR